MLTAFGDAAIIGGITYVCEFSKAGKLVQMYDGSVSTTGPLLTVSTTTAALITENSTVITVAGTTYQATRKQPDGAGFVELELTKDY